MIRRSVIDTGIRWALRGATYCMVAVVTCLVADVVWKGLPAISWTFLTQAPRRGGVEGGIFPAIVGTSCLVGLAFCVALPLGMASAIYLSEYARQGRFNRMVRLAIITLAGVPSIVFGLFGLGLFVLFFHFGASILSGGLTLACMRCRPSSWQARNRCAPCPPNCAPAVSRWRHQVADHPQERVAVRHSRHDHR